MLLLLGRLGVCVVSLRSKIVVRNGCLDVFVVEGEENIQLNVPCPGLLNPPPSPVVTSTVEIPAILATLITRLGLCISVPLLNNPSQPTVM